MPREKQLKLLIQILIWSDLLLIFITFVWGFSIPLMRNALAYMPNQTYLFYRFLLASMVLTLLFGRKILQCSLKSIIRGVIVGIFLAGSLLLTVYAIKYTTASNVSFISGLNIIAVPFFSSIISKYKLDIRGKIGIIIATFGLFLISGGINFSFNYGDFLSLLCAICLAFQIIFIDLYAKEEDPIVLGTIQVYTATVIYFIVLSTSNVSFLFEINKLVIFTIALTGIISTALAFAGQTYVQQFTSPSHVAIIFVLEPVFGAFFSSILPDAYGNHETLGDYEIIGGILLIISMLLVVIQKKEKSSEIKMFNGSVMEAKNVSRIAYRALMRGKPVAVAGLVNKMLVCSIRFFPRNMVVKMGKSLMEKI